MMSEEVQMTPRMVFNQKKRDTRDAINKILEKYEMKLEKNFALDYPDVETIDVCARVIDNNKVRGILYDGYAGMLWCSIVFPLDDKEHPYTFEGGYGFLTSCPWEYDEKIGKRDMNKLNKLMLELGEAYIESQTSK